MLHTAPPITCSSAKKNERLQKKLLHYMGKALADYQMLQHGDRLLVCLSGGKDSYTMLKLLMAWRLRSRVKVDVLAFTLDQTQPGWDDTAMRLWLQQQGVAYHIMQRDTYSVVKEKIPAGKSYCSLCSRLRRGNIYRFAREHGFNKIALGHHRDDLLQTLLMSICYNGQVKSMPPKLLTDDKRHIVIRPLVYCQEEDIRAYAKLQRFPLIPCNLCGSQKNLKRQQIASLLRQLTEDNPKVPSNMLHALGSIKPSQMLDRQLWDFQDLELQLEVGGPNESI